MLNFFQREITNRKLVVVACPMGRCGTSMMMGLLEIAGLGVGSKKELTKPASMNPKGFYELKSHNKFLRQVYIGFYPDIVIPPNLDTLQSVSAANYKIYSEFLKNKFDRKLSVAVKSPRMLTIPFIYNLRKDFDIKVLVMQRNREDQAKSILRVWKKSNNLLKQNATEEFVKKWLEKWIEFSMEVRKYYDLDYLDVDFDKLVKEPVIQMKKITNFIGIPCPKDNDILEWVEPSLINRNKII